MSVFVDTMRSLLNGNSGGRIEQCCEQLGLSIAERDGKTLVLYFKDDLVGRRKLCISRGDGALVLFTAFSHAILPASRLPDDLAKCVLRRNDDLLIGKWSMSVDDDGDVVFALQYCALGDGINAASFKHVAQALINEANEFDAKMARAGLLRT